MMPWESMWASPTSVCRTTYIHSVCIDTGYIIYIWHIWYKVYTKWE